jgi:hypothetical protein
MEPERAKRLAAFVTWVGPNIQGDEKGEAQVYLGRFFHAFWRAGVRGLRGRLRPSSVRPRSNAAPIGSDCRAP